MTTKPLRLGGVPEHFNHPWHLAMASPDLADLALTWEDQPGGTGEMVAKLEAGELDMVSILTEGTIAAIDRGLPATILQVYVSSPLRWGVFVPAGSGVHREAELEGARIAISRFGSGSHLIAFIHAEANGWTITDDQFIVVGTLDGAVESFADGGSDLFLWDQYMTRPLVDAGRFRQVGVQETPWPSFVLAAHDDALTGRTADVGRVADAVVARAVALHDRPGVVDEMAQRYGLTADTVRSWLEATRFMARSPMDTELPRTVLDTLARAGFR